MSLYNFLKKRTGMKERTEEPEQQVFPDKNGAPQKQAKRVSEVAEEQILPNETQEKIETDAKQRGQGTKDSVDGQIKQSVYGVRFPWEAWFFVVVGALSEVVDALFMNTTLETLDSDLSPWVARVISAIVGAGCFFSMAFVGFQQGNRRYYSEIGIRFSYGFWACAGLALIVAKVLAGLVSGGLDAAMAGTMPWSKLLATEDFISNFIIAVVQLVLYIGTGFMTRDSVRILTDNDLREYFLARRNYEKCLEDLSEQRGHIVEDISKLQAYPKYAGRLVNSRRAVKRNIAQYNESARALIEARMAITVEPDLMEEMYDHAMAKEGRPVKNNGPKTHSN